MTSVINLDPEPNTTTRDSNPAEEPRVSNYDDASIEEKPRVSPIQLDSTPPVSDVNPSVDVEAGVRVSESLDDGNGESNDNLSVEGEFDDDKNDVVSSRSGGKAFYSSLLSEFEDFVANENKEASAATSRARSYGFEVGDMVWGKVKSHPWWPGHIFNEAFASSSVRRTRREGHVLVAFFGDSSYGWFDPAELIPFDPHFAEKSQQMNSRNFIKAVEEAVDEASRRCGLGLTCRCRNKYNFRPTEVQGYYSVDVPDYEAGGVYSVSQITKARDEFSPGKLMGFVEELAVVLQSCDMNSIEFIKNKASVFAFRKAVFEEYDETYAEAFGTQPLRPSIDASKVSDQPLKAPTRAPLSGPLVIAEALGDKKNLKRPPKVKDHVKKDKYLFKRRDEPSDSKTVPIGQMQDGSFGPASYMEGSSMVAAGDYGLQKRMPAPNSVIKHEQTGLISKETAGPRDDKSGLKQFMSEQTPGNLGVAATRGDDGIDDISYVVQEKSSLQRIDNKRGDDGIDGSSDVVQEKDSPQRMDNKLVADVAEGGTCTVRSDSSSKEDNFASVDDVLQFSHREGEARADLKYDESAKAVEGNEGSQLKEMSTSARVEGDRVDKLEDGTPGSHPSASVSKSSPVIRAAAGGVKKANVLKRPFGDINSENSVMGEKKKKKKKVLGPVANPDHPKKHLATGKVKRANSAGKFNQGGLSPPDDNSINPQKKNDGSNISFSSTPQISGVGSIQLDLPELLHDLHALALDAHHVGEQNHLSITKWFFLRFRSLVYQKSLLVSPSSGTETAEIRTSSSNSTIMTTDNSVRENDMPSKSVVRPLGRPDDPTKAGQKRLPSDRQEEIAAKRLKKINRLKSMAAEKKASQKLLDTQREVKEAVVAPTPKLVKPPSVKRMEHSVKTVEPTMLVMKFPPQTSLPSGAELKAKFARFGSIDQSAIRVFWKSSMCRVVFRYKSDAQAAYRYALGNKSLFGNLEVRYNLRAVGAATEAPESDNARGGETSVELPRVKEPLLERPTPLAPIPLPSSTIQPKSILKKPAGDEAAAQGTGNNGGRGTSRVKFMLGGEETSTTNKATGQMTVGYRNNNNSTSIGDGGATTSVAMEYNSKNFQKFVPSSTSNLPSQYAKTPQPLNNTNLQNANAPPTTSTSTRQNVDISHEMLSLLTKCNDVVTGVRGLLGYVPYHPL